MVKSIVAWVMSLFIATRPVVVQAPPFSIEIDEIPVEISQILDPDLIVYSTTTPVYCSCVRTARSLGAKIPFKDAVDIEANSMPVVGGGVLFSYEDYDHVAKIVALLKDGMMIQEGNFRRCQYTERFIRYDDKFIRGFHYSEGD